MILKEFSSTPTQSINRLNQRLNEQYGITVKQRVYTREKLEQLRESATRNVQRLKEENHKFQLDPEYAKFLGVKDITDIMLREGIYEGGRAYQEAENFVRVTLDDLIQNKGYDEQLACEETRNRCRMQPNALPDTIYDEILERCMMEMTSAGGVALEESGSTEERVQELMGRYPEQFADFMAGEPVDSEFIDELHAILEPDLPQDVLDGGDAENAMFELLQQMGYGDESLNEQSDYYTIDVWSVIIPANVYDGKYYDYRAVHLKLAKGHDGVDTEQDAINWVKSNRDEVYRVLGNKKTQSGRRYVAHPVEENVYIDEIRQVESSWVGTQNPESTATRIPNLDVDQLRSNSAAELNENVNVDEAEVVMALRAQSNVLADQIEKLGRMINEDLVKITEQIGNEMGQDVADQVQSSVTDTLQQHLDSARSAKEAMDDVVHSVAQGQAPGGPEASPDLDDEDPQGDMPDMDLDLDDEEMDDAKDDAEADINEPEASGPADEPMGRAEI